MSRTLPRLRWNLDFMPSPAEDRPGLLIRDPFRYSDRTLIVPPQLVEPLEMFDGQQTDLELRQKLVEVTGSFDVGDLLAHLEQNLSEAGFLEDEAFERLKAERHREFAEAPVREPAHAGAAYPDEPEELTEVMNAFLDGGSGAASQPYAIAAPHVSPEGGWQSYREAYKSIGGDMTDRTFVVLGTSHYGQAERFGLTRKSYATPFGNPLNALNLTAELERAAPDSVVMEDYCHAVEHSIEFQILFLQHLYGPSIRVLPVLCGSFANSIYLGGKPESDPKVARFFDALGNLAAREGDRLFWVLGVDMAHIGRRYGDPFAAEADAGHMLEVAARDRSRIDAINAFDGDAFWDQVQENRDDLKWCGSSPFYTFLKCAPKGQGSLRRYEQWNIDDQSVVSFAGISFTK